ncbi:hypothetical protein [Prauserella flavalba]|uniref:Uncharacterized protein n=1 Tax=Prauserella flavalba TaxID=1477506 RepID=A0A318LPZ0_9PSEU|nr:hypothetical protein [Prauserella flavalba]PXY21891.1 hypothetical protein BA062_30545 [Prauserella flavalba]
MSRFVTKLAVGGAVVAAFAVAPVVAQAQDRAVDEDTGPVAFANVAAVRIGEDGGSVISETQRSPLLPGTSRLAQSRSALPGSDGEREAVGPHYLLRFGTVTGGESPFPGGVTGGDHEVTATLEDTTVPTATAEADYALRDLASDTTVVAFERARSTVECAAPDALTAETTTGRLWVLGEERAAPAGDEPLRIENLPFGPPTEVEGADPAQTVSDVTISRVTSFDQLVRQDQWRSGPVTTAAGWQLEIVTHVRDAEGADLRDVTTRFVLGGVSCSLPDGFTPVTSDPGEDRADPVVPVKIPAGAQADTGAGEPFGWALVGGGVVLGVAALLLARSRRQATALEGEE